MKKYSRQIPIDTLKLLLARSGNQCSFPDCSHPLFDNKNLFIAQLCHIEAVSPNGQRHNPDKTNEETNSYDNLLFLCYRHHKETDNVALYPVQKLKDIKYTHETKYKEASYDYTPEALNALKNEIAQYWIRIDKLHLEHSSPEFTVPINANCDILALIAEIDEHLFNLSEINSVLMEDCKSSHFEYICLAMPNLLTQIGISLNQIEIKYVEELIIKTPEATELKEKIIKMRDHFQATVQSTLLAD